jgi:hypothetical protein
VKLGCCPNGLLPLVSSSIDSMQLWLAKVHVWKGIRYSLVFWIKDSLQAQVGGNSGFSRDSVADLWFNANESMRRNERNCLTALHQSDLWKLWILFWLKLCENGQGLQPDPPQGHSLHHVTQEVPTTSASLGLHRGVLPGNVCLDLWCSGKHTQPQSQHMVLTGSICNWLTCILRGLN